MCVDYFFKWVEVVLFRRIIVSEVGKVFVEVCFRWGLFRVIRCDNGKEFVNVILGVFFEAFGVEVRYGVVRYFEF